MEQELRDAREELAEQKRMGLDLVDLYPPPALASRPAIPVANTEWDPNDMSWLQQLLSSESGNEQKRPNKRPRDPATEPLPESPTEPVGGSGLDSNWGNVGGDAYFSGGAHYDNGYFGFMDSEMHKQLIHKNPDRLVWVRNLLQNSPTEVRWKASHPAYVFIHGVPFPIDPSREYYSEKDAWKKGLNVAVGGIKAALPAVKGLVTGDMAGVAEGLKDSAKYAADMAGSGIYSSKNLQSEKKKAVKELADLFWIQGELDESTPDHFNNYLDRIEDDLTERGYRRPVIEAVMQLLSARYLKDQPQFGAMQPPPNNNEPPPPQNEDQGPVVVEINDDDDFKPAAPLHEMERPQRPRQQSGGRPGRRGRRIEEEDDYDNYDDNERPAPRRNQNGVFQGFPLPPPPAMLRIEQPRPPDNPPPVHLPDQPNPEQKLVQQVLNQPPQPAPQLQPPPDQPPAPNNNLNDNSNLMSDLISGVPRDDPRWNSNHPEWFFRFKPRTTSEDEFDSKFGLDQNDSMDEATNPDLLLSKRRKPLKSKGPNTSRNKRLEGMRGERRNRIFGRNRMPEYGPQNLAEEYRVNKPKHGPWKEVLPVDPMIHGPWPEYDVEPMIHGPKNQHGPFRDMRDFIVVDPGSEDYMQEAIEEAKRPEDPYENIDMEATDAEIQAEEKRAAYLNAQEEKRNERQAIDLEEEYGPRNLPIEYRGVYDNQPEFDDVDLDDYGMPTLERPPRTHRTFIKTPARVRKPKSKPKNPALVRKPYRGKQGLTIDVDLANSWGGTHEGELTPAIYDPDYQIGDRTPPPEDPNHPFNRKKTTAKQRAAAARRQAEEKGDATPPPEDPNHPFNRPGYRPGLEYDTKFMALNDDSNLNSDIPKPNKKYNRLASEIHRKRNPRVGAYDVPPRYLQEARESKRRMQEEEDEEFDNMPLAEIQARMPDPHTRPMIGPERPPPAPVYGPPEPSTRHSKRFRPVVPETYGSGRGPQKAGDTFTLIPFSGLPEFTRELQKKKTLTDP